MTRASVPVWVWFLCPCGCGTEVLLPAQGAGVGASGRQRWRVTLEDGGATLNPSVVVVTQPRRSPLDCGAHFFVRRSRLVWCGVSPRR